MNQPPPYKPTLNQMQAQAQAALSAQQQAYISAATLQAQGVQHVGHWLSPQAPSCSPTGAAYIAYMGANGAIFYAVQNPDGTLSPCSAQGTSGASISLVESRPSIKIEECGVRAGEIIAYRAWNILGNDPSLRSMYVDYIWRPEAQKIREKTLNPHSGNGFHAFKTLEKCKYEYPNMGTVYGEVALWGEVIEHERGYRAECARVTRIIEICERPVGARIRELFGTRIIDKLRYRYGVKK